MSQSALPGGLASQSILQALPAPHCTSQGGSVQVKSQVLPPAQVHEASAHSATQVDCSPQETAHGPDLQVKVQSAWLHTHEPSAHSEVQVPLLQVASQLSLVHVRSQLQLLQAQTPSQVSSQQSSPWQESQV